jgi:predicted DNA-binding WGR domain protein
MKLVKKIEMTCTIENHNKYWSIELYDNNVVTTTWGKIGSTLSTKEFPFNTIEEAEAFLHKKVIEKTNKGYV